MRQYHERLEEIQEKDRETISQYLKTKELTNFKANTTINYFQALKKLSDAVEPPILEITEAEMRDFWMNEEEIGHGTRKLFATKIRKFYIDHGIKDGPVNILNTFANPNENLNDGLSIHDLVTYQEMQKIRDACKRPRDRMIVTILFDLGLRIGELVALQIRDIVLDEDQPYVNVPSGEGVKTGARLIPFMPFKVTENKTIKSLPPLSPPEIATYFNTRTTEPDEPLLVTSKNKKLLPNSIRYVLKTAFADAGIKKPDNPHAIRHACATYRAKQLKEIDSMGFFGWSTRSMCDRYYHRDGHDLLNTARELKGEAREETPVEYVETPVCLRCQHELPLPTHKNAVVYCNACGFPNGDTNKVPLNEQRLAAEQLYKILDEPEVIEVMREVAPRIISKSDQTKIVSALTTDDKKMRDVNPTYYCLTRVFDDGTVPPSPEMLKRYGFTAEQSPHPSELTNIKKLDYKRKTE